MTMGLDWTGPGRERLAERIADRLDLPVTAAGALFLLLVLAETVSDPAGTVGTAFTAVGWVLWGLFVTEFLVRLVVAPSRGTFLRRNWWQIAFLAVPALRFLRGLRALRVARVSRVMGAALRSGRSATRKLSSRLATLAVVTIVILLAASQLLFELGAFDTYGEALHAAALATVGGEPLNVHDGAARVLDVALVGYSTVVVAALAGSVGAYLVERHAADAARPPAGASSDEAEVDAAGPRPVRG